MINKLLIVLILFLTFISCNDDDNVKPIDYRQYISINNSQIVNHSYNVIAYKSLVKNSSNKTIEIEINFTTYIGNMPFQSFKTSKIILKPNETKVVYETFKFNYFSYQIYEAKEIHFIIYNVS